jgi:acetyltransferase-like isoleucine patch superfamily enzyme
VGSGAIIHPGVLLGNNCIIGSGAVVLANVDEGVTVVGIPGRPIRL